MSTILKNFSLAFPSIVNSHSLHLCHGGTRYSITRQHIAFSSLRSDKKQIGTYIVRYSRHSICGGGNLFSKQNYISTNNTIYYLYNTYMSSYFKMITGFRNHCHIFIDKIFIC